LGEQKEQKRGEEHWPFWEIKPEPQNKQFIKKKSKFNIKLRNVLNNPKFIPFSNRNLSQRGVHPKEQHKENSHLRSQSEGFLPKQNSLS
jgi:hypothetical protein